MWYILYNTLLLLATPVIVAILLAKRRCRPGFPQRIGWRAPEIAPGGGATALLWVHAVSLGEVVAAVPLIRALKERYPAARIVVTTVTETGREAVWLRLGGLAEHAYAPLDLPWAVTRMIDALRPSACLIVETELWPNLFRQLAARRIPIMLVNGRLSSDSFRGYRRMRPFMREVLGHLDLALMQTDRDVDRLVALGAPADRVRRTGNLKFDQPVQQAEQQGPPRALLVRDDEILIVAGSTHPGEEDIILEAYRELARTRPWLVLMLAPRHIERSDDVAARVKAAGLPSIRRSVLTPTPTAGMTAPRVIILDTRGELAAVYRHAAVAYVGGTLVPVGGHNLLEPAHWDKPVCFGPHTDHCAEIAQLLIAAGAGWLVTDAATLRAAFAACLDDTAVADRMGRAGRRVVEENRGAIERTVAAIEKILGR